MLRGFKKSSFDDLAECFGKDLAMGAQYFSNELTQYV
jgi:hypothetical protein